MRLKCPSSEIFTGCAGLLGDLPCKTANLTLYTLSHDVGIPSACLTSGDIRTASQPYDLLIYGSKSHTKSGLTPSARRPGTAKFAFRNRWFGDVATGCARLRKGLFLRRSTGQRFSRPRNGSACGAFAKANYPPRSLSLQSSIQIAKCV